MGRYRTCCVPKCKSTIANTMLMCKPHWFQVSKPVRNQIWKFYKDQDWVNHGRVVKTALKELERKNYNRNN